MISVIIVNFNSGDRLRKCLEHLALQTFRDFETIVIDNASSDDSLESAQQAPLEFRIVKSGANIGFAAANNKAAEIARGEWLVFLNPDAYAEPDWLAELSLARSRYPDCDAFGSTQLKAEDPSIIDGAGDVYHILGIPYRGHFGWPAADLPPEGECFAPCAAAAMYRAEVFRALGGFDERFFCYGEDVDLGFRLRLSGGRAVQIKTAVVRHEGSGITGRHSAFTTYHGQRNRIWIAYKNLPPLLFWTGMPFRLAFDIAALTKAAVDGCAGAYLKGVADGYLGAHAFGADRKRIQSSRRVGIAELSRAIAWSPLKLARRQAHLTPAKTARV